VTDHGALDPDGEFAGGRPTEEDVARRAFVTPITEIHTEDHP
jgi:hypothetical protein